MKKFILILALMTSIAQAAQQPQPIVQGNYIYYPVPINNVQQYQTQQYPQQQQGQAIYDTRNTVQGITNIMGDVSTGAQTVQQMLYSFKDVFNTRL